MCVACQVLDHVLGAAKRPLSIDHPSFTTQLAQESVECE
jgi:hypothetical protein